MTQPINQSASEYLLGKDFFFLIYTELKFDPKPQATTAEASRTKQTKTKALKTKQRTNPVANF